MMRSIVRVSIIVAATLSHFSCVILQSARPTDPKTPVVAPENGYGTLERLPFKEAWYGMYIKDEKVGYKHVTIEPSGLNYKISSESTLRLNVMNKTNESQTKEKVIVRPDLTLLSFETLVRTQGHDLRMIGRSLDDRFLVELMVDGKRLPAEFPVQGAMYHLSAIPFMPCLKGLAEGRTHSFAVLSPDKQGMQKVEQKVTRVKGEPGPGGAVWNVKNSYGRTTADLWVDQKGLIVMERGAEGTLVTMLEDESTARAFRDKKGAGKDLAFDLSLVNVSRPIPYSERTKFLKLRLSGIEPSAVPDDHRQRVSRAAGDPAKGFEVVVRTEDPVAIAGQPKEPSGESVKKETASTATIQSDDPEIVAQANKIVAARDPDLDKVRKLAQWTATNIKHSMKKSITALSALRAGEGDCGAHTRLYTALARSQKIPTQLVTGLVFTQDVGFLYHVWAESYVYGWISVDPTLNQVPADATHIKIIQGEPSDAAATLVNMIGKVKIDVEEVK